jgi:16S rRNA processing protein RimM
LKRQLQQQLKSLPKLRLKAEPDMAKAPQGEVVTTGDLVLIGEFGRAVGLKGEVRVKSYTATPSAIGTYAPLLNSRGVAFSITSLRPVPGEADVFVATVKGVTDRVAAERLNRITLHVARAQLPVPDDDNEFLQADLIGLNVEGPDGAALGVVVSVATYGAGDVLEVQPLAGGPTALVPFQNAFVPIVDIAGKRLVISDASLLAVEPPKVKPKRVKTAPATE